MKVLFVSCPLAGHFNPLVPLIKALRAGGDEVVVATGSDISALVENSGATHFVAGHGESRYFERLRARTRGNPGDGIAPERINHYFVPRMFGEIAVDDVLDDVLACGRELRPDLVVFENYALAGPLVASVLGVRSVQHLVGPLLPHEVLVLANDAVSPIWRSVGLDVPGYAGVYRDVTIAICPPSLETLEPPAGSTMAIRPAPLPAFPVAPSNPPLVYVTFGTFFSSNLAPFTTVLESLANEPVDVLVTVGTAQDPAARGPLPANTRAERFVPQSEVLPHCAVVVHHGGSGTMFGSLAHGVPQVIVPQGADNFDNAAMCERAGCALALRPGDFSAVSVAEAVRRVRTDPSFAASARRAAEEIAAMPSPDDVAAALRRLH